MARKPNRGFQKTEIKQWAAKSSLRMMLGGGCGSVGCQRDFRKKNLRRGPEAAGCQQQLEDGFFRADVMLKAVRASSTDYLGSSCDAVRGAVGIGWRAADVTLWTVRGIS